MKNFFTPKFASLLLFAPVLTLATLVANTKDMDARQFTLILVITVGVIVVELCLVWVIARYVDRNGPQR